jgi:transcriptional regulator of nitric oxide reductase/ferredoxin
VPQTVRLLALALSVAVAVACLSAWEAAGAETAALSPEQLQAAFPGAERAGAFEGTPPAAPVYKGGTLAGYLVSTHAAVGSTGYSGKPLDVLVGVGTDAVVAGAVLVEQTEPILVIGISEQQLSDYVGSFRGFDLKGRVSAGEQSALPDAVSGATVSSAVIRDAILRAARAVVRSRLAAAASEERLDRETVEQASWPDLAADGSVASTRLTEERDGRNVVLLEVYAALLTPPRIGESLLGKLAYNRLLGSLGPDDHLILIAANGFASIKGTSFVRSGHFERMQIVQGQQTVALTTDGYSNVEGLKAAEAPTFREIGVFTLRQATGFDPLTPWRLEVRLPEEAGHGGGDDEGESAIVSLSYELPDRYRVRPARSDFNSGSAATNAQAGATHGEAAAVEPPAEIPLWQEIWLDRAWRIGGVAFMLVVLTGFLVFQRALVDRPLLYRRLRLAFLTVTLVWLGWFAGAQLSVVNVLTFSHALMGDFAWTSFLAEPLIFILWAYTAVALLFLARGVFCGWLCPFGALQELANEAARRLRIPQVTVPFGLHERLWPIKYVIFLALFALSLTSMTDAFVAAEVEPFKTAISLRFLREWPFVAYVVILVVASLFINRFFCRYLCPLGAALAITARLRMFDWLKRHPQCGRECQICFHSCPVQAIHPEGNINPNECIHCLKCQSLYLDDTICPPLVARRKRRERREALSAGRDVSMAER